MRNQNMSKEVSHTEQGETVDFLKEEYAKRVDETDNFSKRIFVMYDQISTEFLYGSLNIIQHSLELQNKVSTQYGNVIIPQYMTSIVKQNTNAWIHFLQNNDTLYIESLKNLKNNIRAINNNIILCIQSMERGQRGFENIQPNIKNEHESKTLQKQSQLVVKETKTKNQQ